MSASPLPQEKLASLVAQAQDGDTDAFGKIYDEFLTPVYRYVVFRFPKELAEDLVADIFVKAWEKLHTYQPRKNVPFSAWLFRIARHVVIDAYRSQRGFDEIPETIVDETSWSKPDHKANHALVMKIVRKAMNALPKRYRETLLLSYVSELSTREVAKAMRVSEGSVRILRFRALKKLQDSLPPSLQDHP